MSVDELYKWRRKLETMLFKYWKTKPNHRLLRRLAKERLDADKIIVETPASSAGVLSAGSAPKFTYGSKKVN